MTILRIAGHILFRSFILKNVDDKAQAVAPRLFAQIVCRQFSLFPAGAPIFQKIVAQPYFLGALLPAYFLRIDEWHYFELSR